MKRLVSPYLISLPPKPGQLYFMISKLMFHSITTRMVSVLCLQLESKNWKSGSNAHMITTRQISMGVQQGRVPYYEHTVFLASFLFVLEFLFAFVFFVLLAYKTFSFFLQTFHHIRCSNHQRITLKIFNHQPTQFNSIIKLDDLQQRATRTDKAPATKAQGRVWEAPCFARH